MGLRAALRGWVPDAILDAPKQGFVVPDRRVAARDLRDHAHDVLLDPVTLGRGCFRAEAVRNLLGPHLAGIGGPLAGRSGACTCSRLGNARSSIARRRRPGAGRGGVVGVTDRSPRRLILARMTVHNEDPGQPIRARRPGDERRRSIRRERWYRRRRYASTGRHRRCILREARRLRGPVHGRRQPRAELHGGDEADGWARGLRHPDQRPGRVHDRDAVAGGDLQSLDPHGSDPAQGRGRHRYLPPSLVSSNVTAAPIPNTPVFQVDAKASSPHLATKLSVLSSEALVRDVGRNVRVSRNSEELFSAYKAAAARENLALKYTQATAGRPASEPAGYRPDRAQGRLAAR